MDDPVEIGSTADRSSETDSRRNALVGVAVVVVLALVVGAGVLVARSGEEGVGGGGDGAPYALPPAGVEIVVVHTSMRDGFPETTPTLPVDPEVERVGSYTIVFRDPSGHVYALAATRTPGNVRNTIPNDDTPLSDVPAGEALMRLDLLPSVAPWETVDLTTLDPAVVTCPYVHSTLGPDGERRSDPTGPVAVLGLVGSTWGVALHAVSTVPLDGPSPACEIDRDKAVGVVENAQDLRLVGEEEWRSFMEEHRHLTQLPEWLGGPSSTRPPDPTATAVPSIAIPNEDEARAGVIAAFEGLDHQAADGTYPNVETGDDVAFWQPFFEEAAATPQITAPGGFTVDDVAFLSEDRARVRFQAHAENNGQQIHVSLSGEAVRIGDRWYVSRDTMIKLLNGAVSPERRR
jgi:hypothetical protein